MGPVLFTLAQWKEHIRATMWLQLSNEMEEEVALAQFLRHWR